MPMKNEEKETEKEKGAEWAPWYWFKKIMWIAWILFLIYGFILLINERVSIHDNAIHILLSVPKN